MTIQITSKKAINGAVYFTASCGKTEAFVSVNPSFISAVCMNAGSRRTKRSKAFQNFDAALAHFKSSAMQAILQTVQAEVAS